MKIAIINFPFSREHLPTAKAFVDAFSTKISFINWYETNIPPQIDLLIMPAGSSYGDALRPGAIAAHAFINNAIKLRAKEEGKIMGFGNGFQILCEMNLIPGRLLINPSLNFLQKTCYVIAENKNIELPNPLPVPISCHFGRYFANTKSIMDMEENQQILLRYSSEFGEVNSIEPFNECTDNIAAATNKRGNVIGIMPRLDRSLLDPKTRPQSKELIAQIIGL